MGQERWWEIELKRTYSYGRHSIGEDDIEAVTGTLKGDWLTQGPKVQEFEKALGVKFGSKRATVVCNGTAALHLCGLALGWQRGDIVITSPITFLATANCIVYAGATPDFVDIDGLSYTLDLNRLEEKLKRYHESGKKVKAVIGVDFAGHPCDWHALREMADKYDFQLVNDACHAMGAELSGDQTYGAKYADLVVFSFHPVKHITTGEGGAILTNRIQYDDIIRVLRTHGMVKENTTLEKNDGPWYYEMHSLGFNYRITDLQCALGLSQLSRLNVFVRKRRQLAQLYDELLSNDERFNIPNVRHDCSHAFHLYPLLVEFDQIGKNKKDFFHQLKGQGINVQVHYIPVHLQPFYRKNYGFQIGDFPAAEEFYRKEVSIPMYPDLGQEDLNYIADNIKLYLK